MALGQSCKHIWRVRVVWQQVPRLPRRQFSAAAANHSAKLKILFCGSDAFSCASLLALKDYATSAGSNVDSIDVVTRKDKRTGRGLKTISNTPLKVLAESLGLPLHQIDTFTGWKPSNLFPTGDERNAGISLIVAVSFGLLIPARILRYSQFGGLNVHPSLLPDLAGAAPIQWAIMKGYQSTGVTVQTLHPTQFDGGSIVSQQSVQIRDPETCGFEDLRDQLAPVGAKMVVDIICGGLYQSILSMPPVALDPDIETTKAPRLTTEMMRVDFQKQESQQILRMSRAFPQLWTEVVVTTKNDDDKISHPLRLTIYPSLMLAEPFMDMEVRKILEETQPGVPFAITPRNGSLSDIQGPLKVKAADGVILSINSMVVAGKPVSSPLNAAHRAHLFSKPILTSRCSIHFFQRPLMSHHQDWRR